MEVNIPDRKRVISELQRLAEEVIALKNEHRQKRPIVIEFSGCPKAGKTSCINSLELFLKRNGFSVQIVQERASVCPVTDKHSPMFNLWTSCMALAGMIGTLENKKHHVDVLILDRGIFDAICWFEWLASTSKMEESQRRTIEQFLLMEELVNCIDIVFAFIVDPNLSISREYAALLTDKPGSIMNTKVLGEYLSSVKHTIKTKAKYFHMVFRIDTSNKYQDDVSKEVTAMTLVKLKSFLMERIGFFRKTPELLTLINNNSVIEHEDILPVLPRINFGFREDVERNPDLIQPLPIAVITNKARDKLLVIKKNKSAVSNDSPERNKHLVYIGGHSRFEDATDINADDFLAICKNTLKREVKEEIGISVAVNDVVPFYMYMPTSTTSRMHFAVCFIIPLEEDGLKFQLDSQELVLTKGKSKSGRFLDISDLLQESDLEDWSKTILNHFFGTSIPIHTQTSMFDLD